MQLNTTQFAIAAAITAWLWYIICIIAVMVAPSTAVWLFSTIVHMTNIDGMMSNTGITLTSGIVGFVQVTLYAFLTTYVFARMYNKLVSIL